MVGSWLDIDTQIILHCGRLEQWGVPLDSGELNLRIFRKTAELNRLKQGINQAFGFLPTFSDESTWKRVYREATGYEIHTLTPTGKVSLSRRTVEELGDLCPALAELYQGIQLERTLSQMTKIAGYLAQSGEITYLKPDYWVDSRSGQIFLRNPNLRAWGKDIKGAVRLPGHLLYLIGYDALDLTVLQDFSQDPVLGSDLESLNPYETMACRFWETTAPSQEQVFITRMAFTLFCSGLKPDKIYYGLNTTYSDYCSISLERADQLYEKFSEHYTVCCEYFNQISRLRVDQRSAFGRWGAGSHSRSYSVTSTVTDITKLGFLGVLGDSRLEKLGVVPLALVSNKMLLSVPSEQDLSQVSGYLMADLHEAYPRYALKVYITPGACWESCESGQGWSQVGD